MTYNLKSISQDSVSWYPQQKQSLSNISLLQKEKGTQKRSLNHMYNLPFTYFRLLERFNARKANLHLGSQFDFDITQTIKLTKTIDARRPGEGD